MKTLYKTDLFGAFTDEMLTDIEAVILTKVVEDLYIQYNKRVTIKRSFSFRMVEGRAVMVTEWVGFIAWGYGFDYHQGSEPGELIESIRSKLERVSRLNQTKMNSQEKLS